MSRIGDFSPTTKPPVSFTAIHKSYQKVCADALSNDDRVLDFDEIQRSAQDARLRLVKEVERRELRGTFAQFEGSKVDYSDIEAVRVYEYRDLPGKSWNETLLSRLLHRDLIESTHKTNVHFHHDVPYDRLSSKSDATVQDSSRFSFFHFPPDCSLKFPALDPDVHKPLTLSQFLNHKLRWMTLGEQYDWTQKAYPEVGHPAFPEDLARLTQSLFPDIHPEAAIVNFYSPGDTLSIHRDVSEDSDAGLVSISLGCDAIFVAGLEQPGTGDVKYVVVRLRSGDAVYMSGPSRFAWHGVPQVVANTCPASLSDWPAKSSPPTTEPKPGEDFEAWRGWMANKRINLNIRQMRD
ncbi:MAG: hypothetical protein Q9170_001177 [Blastenia crenularia]